MSLARSVYETYLHMVWVLNRPGEVHAVSTARVGLLAGTHSFGLTRKGRVNRRVIVENESGKVIHVDVTTSQLAQLSGLSEDVLIHEGLYSLLSQHVHPDYRSAFHYMDEDGFSPRERHWAMPAFAIAAAIHLMIVDALLQTPVKISRTTADLRRYVRRAKKCFGHVAKLAIQSGATSPLPRLLGRRVQRLGQIWPLPAAVAETAESGAADIEE